MRRVGQRIADVFARRRTGERRTVVGTRAHEQDARRPRVLLGECRRPASGRQLGQRAQEGGEVLAGVVPPSVDEVALGQAEPLPLRGAIRTLEGERVARGKWNDPDPVAAETQQAAGRRADGFAADDDRVGVTQQAPPDPLAETGHGRALEGAGELPRSEVKECHDDRQPRRKRQGAAAGRVVDGATGTALPGAPRRPQRRAPQQERVDGHRRRAQQARGRQEPSTHDGQLLEARGRVVEVGLEEERERLAGERLGVEGAEQAPR